MVEEEIKLVKKAKMGDQDAFFQLTKIYKPYISSIARRFFLIGGDVEDIYQEGLFGMYKAVLSYNESENTSFKTFAINCISNSIKTCVTKDNRQKNQALNTSISVDVDMEDEDAWAYILISKELSPEQELIKRQQVKYIIDEIKARLKDSQKEVLKLYLMNKSYAEIAEKIGKDTKYVDNTLTQIKKKLAPLKKEMMDL